MSDSKRQIDCAHVHTQASALRQKAQAGLQLLSQQGSLQEAVSAIIPHLQLSGVPKVLQSFHDAPIPDLGGNIADFVQRRNQALTDFYQNMLNYANTLDQLATTYETIEGELS